MPGSGGREKGCSVSHPASPALVMAAVLTVLGLLTGTAPGAAASEPSGAVVAWGSNGTEALDVPSSLAVSGATAVAAGWGHNLALTPAGQVVTWGRTYRLGATAAPASLAGTKVIAVAAGDHHSLALTAAGEVVGWGDNSHGQALPPASLTGRTVTAISGGAEHSLALTTDGRVVAWGDDSDGQLDVPASLTGKTVTAVAAGGRHSLALTSDGQVVGWGDDGNGSVDVPATLSGQRVTAIAAGSLQSLALTADGQVVSWGRHNLIPAVPASLAGRRVTAISAASSHNLALTADGQVTAWGADTFGESDVPASLGGQTVLAIAAGGRHNVALVKEATLRVLSSPQPARVELGAPASFSATATGAPGLTVQWQRASPGGPFTDVGGARSTTHTFVPVAADDGAVFRAVFTDGTGSVTTDAATLTVNSRPAAKPLDVATAFETPVPVTLSGTDPDADPLTYAVVGQPTHGVLSGTPPRLTYTPAPGYSGTDAFTYTASDTTITSAPATVRVTVGRKPGSAPTAKPLDLTTAFETPVPVTLSGADPDGDPLTYAVVGQPTHGVLSGTPPRLTYTPAPGYSGTDAFTFRVSDGALSSAAAEVGVRVLAPSCVPTAPRSTFRVDGGGSAKHGVLSSPKIKSIAPDQLLVAFVSADGPTTGAQTVTQVSGGGLTWTLVVRENTGGGTSEVWQAYASTKVSATRVTATLAAPARSTTLTVAGFSRARPTAGSAGHLSGTASAPRVPLVPQASGSVVWAAGRATGSRYAPKPVSGQKVVHAQKFRSPSAGSWTQRVSAPTVARTEVTVSDKNTAKAWGYAAVEIRGTCS